MDVPRILRREGALGAQSSATGNPMITKWWNGERGTAPGPRQEATSVIPETSLSKS
jgi:hypothetical protein